MKPSGSRVKVEEYALVGDLHTAALVGRNGGIDWLCLPGFDSPACLAALLDDDHAGTWRIAPAAGGPATRRRYRADTLVLETEWDTPDGTVRLIDCMPPRAGSARIVRVVEGISGRVPMRLLLRLRFDYGHLVPWTGRDDMRLSAVAGPDAVWLDSDVPLAEIPGATRAEFSVAAGQRLGFVLSHTASHLPRPAPVDAEQAVEETAAFWSAWIARSPHRGPWVAEVRRALITLKALTYAPTGGVLTAATTSLADGDGRHCRLWNATSTLRALLDSGYPDEARAWRDWLLRAIAGAPDKMRTSYGPDGSHHTPARQLGWLTGDGGPPVRIGGNANGRVPLTVRGEVLDTLHVAEEAGLTEPGAAWDVRRGLLDHLEGAWDRPDNGLWEVGGPDQHFVHSKVMAWVGLDRAVRAAERHGLSGPIDRWRALRGHIRAEVCSKGYDPNRNTFTRCYGSSEVDAELLLLPAVGFLPWQDARIRGTVEAVHAELPDDDLVAHEDRTRRTASFVHRFWLADALCGIGRAEEATALFERLLALRNDVGLLAEGYDPTHHQTGNIPHTPSLVALVNTAHRLGARPKGSALS